MPTGQLALTWGLPAPAERSASMKHTQMSGSAGFQPATSFEIFGSKTVTLPVCSDGLYALLTATAQKGGRVLNTRLGVPLGVLEFNSRHKQMFRDEERTQVWELEEKDNTGARGEPATSWEGRGVFPKSKGAQSTGREFKSVLSSSQHPKD